MAIKYENLDDYVREAMKRELDLDEQAGTLYLSPRLTDDGVQEWPQLLRAAFDRYDDAWLAYMLNSKKLLRTEEQRRTKTGIIMAKVPVNADEMLAEGEFNRFYARGLCAQVITMGEVEVEVYRGKAVANPRPDSNAKLGLRLHAQQLLNDLRTSQGVEPALKLPPGPNSGLTVRRPRQG